MRHAITYHFANSSERPPESVALRFKRHKSWISWSWHEYFRQTEAVALGLRDLGVKSGDRVAIFANSCWEWSTLDFAVLGMGAVTVPIYHSSLAQELEFILKNSACETLVLQDQTQLRKWESVAKNSTMVKRVIVLDTALVESLTSHQTERSYLSWDELCERGVAIAPQTSGWFLQSCKAIQLDQTASIVYTSGTTGEPKGVWLRHEQLLSEVEAIAQAFPLSADDSSLSFLPFAHVLGRVEIWLHPYIGFTLNIAESIERLGKNLVEVHPTVMIGVPRIFEKVYASVQSELQSQKWRGDFIEALRAPTPLPSWWPGRSWVDRALRLPKTELLDLFVYSRLRERLGGKLRFAVSGGAPLEPVVAQFFLDAGVLLLEGYGLTETTAAICANTPDAFRLGTVGKPLPGVEIKLAIDGEILVRGPMVTPEYYQNPEATREAFVDEYFCTGDIGEWTDEGFLRITDRKKDLIKTAGGKYVAPQKLSALLQLDPLISQVLIHGDRRKYIVALITLEEEQAKLRARKEGWRFRDYRSLTQSPEAREAVRKIVAQVNSQLAPHESIKAFAILPQEFTVASGELTPSLKIKRNVCNVHYKDLLDSLY